MTAPMGPEDLLRTLTSSPFADSLFQILGKPQFQVEPDASKGNAQLGGRYHRTDALHALIGLTPQALQHASEQGDPLNHGYTPVPGQQYGEHALTHEYGHYVADEAKPGNQQFYYKAPPTAFLAGMNKIAGKMEGEAFAEHFNAAVQFLRDGSKGLSKQPKEVRAIARLLLTQPIYAQHPLSTSQQTKAAKDATAVQPKALPASVVEALHGLFLK